MEENRLGIYEGANTGLKYVFPEFAGNLDISSLEEYSVPLQSTISAPPSPRMGSLNQIEDVSSESEDE